MKNENDNISQSTAVYQEFKASSAFKKKKSFKQVTVSMDYKRKKAYISINGE